MSKYGSLREHLQKQTKDQIPMTFSEIERVLGFKLPKSQIYPAWWSNNPTNNVMTNEWLAAGFKTEQIDIEGRKLVFRKMASTGLAEEGGQFAAEEVQHSKKPRRHPGFGLMKGLTKIAPGTDLTAPTGGDWGRSE
jgi:hypothetical protein